MHFTSSKKAAARDVIMQLLEHGYQAYYVGGYVRDVMLNKEVDDIDIATSALPAEVIALFPHTVPTGLQHGTVTVMKEAHAFEVTTFRTESGYGDFRRPEQVYFIDNLIEDLRRRDFSMNAMAMDVEEQLIDPFKGIEDLRQGVLRCVGDPVERFTEDALRMMRCIRFAANYELTVESSTWHALIERRETLRHVAMERIRVELDKTIAGQSPQTGLVLLSESKLLDYCKVNIGMPHSVLQEVTQLRIGHNLMRMKSTTNRWVLLLLTMHMGSNEVKRTLSKLTFSGDHSRTVGSIVAFHEWFLERAEQGDLETMRCNWKKGCLIFGEQVVHAWHLIITELKDAPEVLARLRIRTDLVCELNERGLHWLNEMPVKSLNELQITGRDILPLGEKPGAWVGQVLQQLLLEAAFKRVDNERDALLKHAKKVMEELMKDD